MLVRSFLGKSAPALAPAHLPDPAHDVYAAGLVALELFGQDDKQFDKLRWAMFCEERTACGRLLAETGKRPAYSAWLKGSIGEGPNHSNFTGLVLGCIETKFCNKIFVNSDRTPI